MVNARRPACKIAAAASSDLAGEVERDAPDRQTHPGRVIAGR
jgi:hypothetical protein